MVESLPDCSMQEDYVNILPRSRYLTYLHEASSQDLQWGAQQKIYPLPHFQFHLCLLSTSIRRAGRAANIDLGEGEWTICGDRHCVGRRAHEDYRDSTVEIPSFHSMV